MKRIISTVLLSAFIAAPAISKADDAKKAYTALTLFCTFKDLGATRIDVNLKTRAATVTAIKGELKYYMYPKWRVAAHFEETGRALADVRLSHRLPQLVLVGSNRDDSNFTMNIAYGFGRPVKATLNAYWDGLDGTHEVMTSECAELDWSSMK